MGTSLIIVVSIVTLSVPSEISVIVIAVVVVASAAFADIVIGIHFVSNLSVT